MPTRKLILIVAALIVLALTLGAQEQPKKTIKHVPMRPTSAASGQEMYRTYCAVCHGTDGKGGGPAAEALKTAPTDSRSRLQGDAGVGQIILEHERRTRGRGAATCYKPQQLHRITAGKVRQSDGSVRLKGNGPGPYLPANEPYGAGNYPLLPLSLGTAAACFQRPSVQYLWYLGSTRAFTV
jgi:mono/diheme cytochrome c family protein